MVPVPGGSSSGFATHVLKRAQEHTILIIDADVMRSQKLASLLTLTGLRAINTANTYQAFDRFLKERFKPRLLLLSQPGEMKTPLFQRFYQRLTQEIRYEVPVISLFSLPPFEAVPLVVNSTVTVTKHTFSEQNVQFLKVLWQILPSAQVPLRLAEHTLALGTLPKLGFLPRISRNLHSMSSHLHYQLKAARQTISAEQWDVLLTDVGLSQFVKENDWPPLNEHFTIPPEYFALLTRAVMFSQMQSPLQQVYTWADNVEADILQNSSLLFAMQQLPKVIGSERAMRLLLNALMEEVDKRRGEMMTEWRRQQDGSYIFVFYSNIFTYGVLGANQPLCSMWQSSFELSLRIMKQQQNWRVQEIECSGQTHTGHCVFQISPR